MARSPYFEYDIVQGPANTRVEWIRVYVPGPWQPVADSTMGPAPDSASTYREWHKLQKCIGPVTAREATLWSLSHNRSPMHPSIHGNIVTGTPEDTNDSAIRTRTLRGEFSLWDRLDLMCAGLSSSSTSMISDGG